MVVRLENGLLIVEIPVHQPTPSSTGKTLSVASSSGNKPTKVMIEGKPLIVGLNAHIKV